MIPISWVIYKVHSSHDILYSEYVYSEYLLMYCLSNGHWSSDSYRWISGFVDISLEEILSN